MRPGELGEVRREEPRGPFPGRDAHDAGGLVTKRRAAAVDGGDRLRHALGHREQIMAPASQPVPVGRALEEARAERLLELTQAADDGGLAQTQDPGGPPQTARLGHGQEHPHVIPLHRRTLAALRLGEALRIRSGRSTAGRGAPHPERGDPQLTASAGHGPMVC